VSGGKISVKTDKPAMTREDEVRTSQAAFGAAKRHLADRPGAISVGASTDR
jgi:hypothetical protein